MVEYSDVVIPLSIGVGAWFTAMPDIRELRHTEYNDEVCRDIRHIEATVIGVTLIAGVIGSYMCKNHAPLSAAIVVVLGLMFTYEIALKMEPTSK